MDFENNINKVDSNQEIRVLLEKIKNTPTEAKVLSIPALLLLLGAIETGINAKSEEIELNDNKAAVVNEIVPDSVQTDSFIREKVFLPENVKYLEQNEMTNKGVETKKIERDSDGSFSVKKVLSSSPVAIVENGELLGIKGY